MVGLSQCRQRGSRTALSQAREAWGAQGWPCAAHQQRGVRVLQRGGGRVRRRRRVGLRLPLGARAPGAREGRELWQPAVRPAPVARARGRHVQPHHLRAASMACALRRRERPRRGPSAAAGRLAGARRPSRAPCSEGRGARADSGGSSDPPERTAEAHPPHILITAHAQHTMMPAICAARCRFARSLRCASPLSPCRHWQGRGAAARSPNARLQNRAGACGRTTSSARVRSASASATRPVRRQSTASSAASASARAAASSLLSGTAAGGSTNCIPPAPLAPSRMPRGAPSPAAAATHSRPPCRACPRRAQLPLYRRPGN